MTESSAPVVVVFAVLGGASGAVAEERISVLEALAHGYQGDLVKRLSDGIMAVFPYPAGPPRRATR